MDNRDDVRQFLATRRARITPQQVGLPVHDSNRRVPGLRREEVAVLAGVSIDYYTRLERGNLTGVSDSVLEAIARALQLDEAERSHLFSLARTASNAPTTRRRRPTPLAVRAGLQRLLDAMTNSPALVRNARLDVIATNQLGRALFSPAFDDPQNPTNMARFTFLDACAREFFPDWHDVANTTVALLRMEAAHSPTDRNLSDLVGELATRSEEFRTRWAAAQRTAPRPRRKAPPSPHRRATEPLVRGASPSRRPRPHPDCVHGSTWLPIARRYCTSCELGSHQRARRPRQHADPAGRRLTKVGAFNT